MVKMTTNEIWLLLLLLTTKTMMIGGVICPSLKFRMQNRGNVKRPNQKHPVLLHSLTVLGRCDYCP